MNKIIILALILCSHWLLAQTPDTIKDLPAEQVEVVKQFEARLEDARKVNIVPEPPAQRVLKSFDYNVSIKPLALNYLEPSIRPLSIAKEAPRKFYRGFAEISAGNLRTLDAGFGYHYLTARETEIFLNGDFFTQENKKELFQKYRKIDVDLGVQHHLNELVSFQLGSNYKQRNVAFYGSPLDDFTEVDSSQYFRNLRNYGVNFKLWNSEENEFDLDYMIGFDYQNFSLVNENLYENNFDLNLLARKRIAEEFSAEISGLVDISNILDTATLSYNNYHIRPKLAYHTDDFGLSAGIDLVFAPGGRNYYLPDLSLSYALKNGTLIPFVFWKGEVEKNNLQHLFEKNPFLDTNVTAQLRNTVHQRYGFGLRGRLKALHYETSIGYGTSDDLVLFRNQINDQGLRQFTIDADSARVLNIKANIAYEWSESLDLHAGFDYNYYNIVAWHLPTYTFDIQAVYRTLKNKLAISSTLFLRDGLSVLNDDREVEELPYMVDLNVGANYMITEQFNLFAEINNLLGSEYQEWFDYSNFGLNARIGLKAKF